MAETSDSEKSGIESNDEASNDQESNDEASSEEAAPPKKLTPLEAVKQRQAALAQSRASGTKRGSTSTDAAAPGTASSHRPAVQLQRKAGDS